MAEEKLSEQVLATLPNPADVRHNLAIKLREAAILRRLLKVCEAANAERTRNDVRAEAHAHG